jgi:tRNA A64-2'-O-ribosylphosphate transferase
MSLQAQKNRADSKPVRSARNRLMSICYDVDKFCRPIISTTPCLRNLPIIANERCGLWYAHPLMSVGSATCCFKSTDGHYGSWNFSLKRLNLNVIRTISTHQACILLDASTSKVMPDSFSRTVPIWAAVLNCIATRYRQDFGIPACSYDLWDLDRLLFTPNSIVSTSEHELILSLIDERVNLLYSTGAIVDPKWLASTLLKPIRLFWITPHSANVEEMLTVDTWSDCYSIICFSCSDYSKSKQTIAEDIVSREPFMYFCGAADDHESWARHLTAQTFWDNLSNFKESKASSDDEFNKIIDTIVERESVCSDNFRRNEWNAAPVDTNFDQISNLNIYIGTRRSGRPPECWEQFDAVLNVTDSEYQDIHDSISSHCDERFYLQLPVREGKRDRTELERWLTVGVIFVVAHARKYRKVLVHCAQGADRSVAVVMSVVAIFCDLKFPLQWNSAYWHFPAFEFLDDNVNRCQYLSSGLNCETFESMQGRSGRDLLFKLLCENDGNSSLNVTKGSVRIALHLIQQDRGKANPSRATMQKLHRFFMSS